MSQSSSNRIPMININDPLIAVLAGSKREVNVWSRGNIIPVINAEDILRLRGLSFTDVFEVGTWHSWAGEQELQLINALTTKGR